MFELFLAALVLALAAIAFLFFRRSQELEERVSRLAFEKGSQSVKYGRLSEQWIPLSEKFPFDSSRFKFLGQPIDGVAFLEDKIVFVEFKAASSQLNAEQRRIRSLVESGNVEWLEFRAD